MYFRVGRLVKTDSRCNILLRFFAPVAVHASQHQLWNVLTYRAILMQRQCPDETDTPIYVIFETDH